MSGPHDEFAGCEKKQYESELQYHARKYTICPMSFSSGIIFGCKCSNKNPYEEISASGIMWGRKKRTENSQCENSQSCTPNRAVLEPILADLDRLWEMRH